MTSTFEARFMRHLEHLEQQVRFHGRRAPKYLWRLLYRAPWGFGRVFMPAYHWVMDEEGWESLKIVRQTAGRDGRGVSNVRGLQQDHRKQIAIRLFVALVPVFAFVALVWFGAETTQERVTYAGLLWLVLGWHGRHDRGLMDRPTSGQVVPPISHRLIEEAIEAVGINRVVKAMKVRRENHRLPVDFITEVVHTGKGTQVEFDIPGSVKAANLVAQREELAGGLKRPVERVWIMPVPEENPSRVKLIILDQGMAQQPRIPWPGASQDRSINLLSDQVMMGVDPAGKEIGVWARYTSGVTGAMPRVGKTFTDRLWAAGVLEDDRSELHVYALRATGEFAPLKPLCAAYRSGDSPSDMDALVADLRWAQTEIRRRAEYVDSLPSGLAPESKPTPELSANPEHGLHPIVFLIDEVQLATQHPIHGSFIKEALTEMGTIGQAVNFLLKVATQRPDSEWLPPAIRDNMDLRICLAVKTQPQNDMILGQGMHSAGYRATAPSLTKDHLGVGICVSEGDITTVQFYYADAPMIEAKVKRLKARREATGGLLVGLAAGEELPHIRPDDNEDVGSDLLSVCLRNWPVEFDEAGTKEIVAAITQVPGFETMTANKLTRRLKETHGVRPVDAVFRDGERVGRGHSMTELLRAQRAQEGVNA